MALEGVPRNRGATKTVEQMFHSDNPTVWNESSELGRIHDPEESHLHHHAKKLSVLAKVKEYAKKWRLTLVKKRHGHDANHTPSWGVALEDYEVDEDPDPHGYPAHQPQHTDRSPKDNERHNPVSDSMFPDMHFASNHSNIGPGNQDLGSLSINNKNALFKSYSIHEGGTPSLPIATVDETLRGSLRQFERENHRSPSPSKCDDGQKGKLPSSDTTDKPVPVKTRVVDDVEKGHDDCETPETEGGQNSNVSELMDKLEKRSPTKMKAITDAVSEATSKITSKIQSLSTAENVQDEEEDGKWDKGVSVTEYLKSKLEPGEDERALSQVISEVISPRRSPTEKGVVEKMRAAVTLLLHSEEPSASTPLKTSDSYPRIPVSTNAHEVEEKNQERVLQAN